MLNRLTPLYSKIYYKEENYLKVKTGLFIYPSPPYSKVWYVSTSVRSVYKYINTRIYLIYKYLYNSATPYLVFLTLYSIF